MEEGLELLLKSAVFGIFVGSLLENLHSYFSISSQLYIGSWEDIHLQEDIAKQELENIEKKNKVIQYLFFIGSKLAYRNFLKEVGGNY